MAELPRASKVELLVSDVDVLGPCCSCREKEGVLRCSGCKAVGYCGEECQDKGWNDHKEICNEINQLLQDVKVAIETLANEYGGVEALLEAPLVKDGLFTFRDTCLSSEDSWNFSFNMWGQFIPPTETDKYDIARWKLINAYAKCGKEASSKLAFRLAAENLIHMIQLCRNGKWKKENYENENPSTEWFTWHKYCGWMVAGGMDQQALNFLGYIQSKDGWIQEMITLDWDLSVEEDIEGLSVVSRVKENVISPLYHQTIPRIMVHDFMLISLMKFKRIKALSARRKGEEERWNTFLEGTQSRDGPYSVVFMLSGMAPVLEKLKGFIVDKSIDERIYLLTNQVNELLIEVNEENPKLIQGVLDRHVHMVDDDDEDEDDEDDIDLIEYESHLGFISYIPGNEKEVHIARYAVSKYGHAWHIDKDCVRALRLFLETGNVMKEESSPETEMAEEDTSPETEMEEEDTSPETEMEEEDTSPVSEMAEDDTSPETEMTGEDTSPKTEMEEEDTSPVSEMAEEDTSPETLEQDDKVANLGAAGKVKENKDNTTKKDKTE